MSETLKASSGVGLAAPQVGVSCMLLVIDWSSLEEGGDYKAYINPEVIETGGKIEAEREGCLSLPEVWADVERYNYIIIKYSNIENEIIEEELTDLPARVFQHEYDHLIGVLFIDRIAPADRNEIKVELQAILDGVVIPFDGTLPDKSKSNKIVAQQNRITETEVK